MTRLIVLLCAALAAVSFVGCKKKAAEADSTLGQQTVPPAAAATAAKLSGADQVMAAIDKKDYDGAVRMLVQIRQSAQTDDQKTQFLVLANDAKTKLLAASATDPAAAQAAAAVRSMILGR